MTPEEMMAEIEELNKRTSNLLACRNCEREKEQAEAKLAEAQAEVERLTAERASVPHLGLKIRAEQAEAALAAERDALHGTALKLEAERERSERLRTALEMIAGQHQCADSLMSNVDKP